MARKRFRAQDRDQDHLYATEAQEAAQAAMRRPTTFEDHLSWYAYHWSLEMPDRIHVRGVWYGRQQVGREGEDIWAAELTGGSRLHAPAVADGFRRYIENSDWERDDEGDYLRPMHAAVRRMLLDGPRREAQPTLALWLLRLAVNGFSWAALADAMHRPHDEVRAILDSALRQLYDLYQAGPDDQPASQRSAVQRRIGRSESQAIAERGR
jgi:hypothetical protein